MIRRDYIMKMLMQLARALTRVLKLKETEKHDDALREIDGIMQRLCGLNSLLVNTLAPQSLLQTLRGGAQLDTGKCLVLGELLVEEAEVLASRGADDDEVVDRYLKALYLLAEAFADNPKLDVPDYPEKIWELADRLEDFVLPADLGETMLWLNVRYGRLSEAEDLLFDLVDGDDAERARRTGVAFYERLLERSDDELERGGLPREEVLEGLARLR